MLLFESAALILFFAVSGCVYIGNDYFDLASDRANPEKQNRPMASGALKPRTALTFAGVVALVAFAVAWKVTPYLTLLLILYVLINIAYTLRLKHIVILDIFAIAAGFVIRAVAGAVAIGVLLTPWFLLCALLLALFLATGKRKSEWERAKLDGEWHRAVLHEYSPALLDQFSVITAALVIVSYAMFTFTAHRNEALMASIPLVIYGVFRYLQLVQVHGQGGHPEHTLWQDRHILVTVLLFGVTVITALCWHR